jgi:hypothetical protein
MTMEHADFVLTLGSYVGSMWVALLGPGAPLDPASRMIAVTSILNTPGLALEVAEYQHRVLELADMPEMKIKANPALLDRVWRVVLAASHNYDFPGLRLLIAAGLDKRAVPAASWSPQPRPNSRNRGALATPQTPTTQCNRCKRRVPSDQLVRQFMPKYMNRRRKNGYVWMCRDCAPLQQTDISHTSSSCFWLPLLS